MKKNVLAVCAALSAVACFADCITIPLTEKSTVVTDGVYSDSEWETASMIGGFIQAKARRMVARDGDVYLTADKEALHVCVRWTVEGSETDGGFVTLAKKDGGPVWADDCFEIFVGSDGGAKTNVYQLLLNGANVRYTTFSVNGKGAGKWEDCKARSASTILSGFWTHEVAIPWTSLKGIDPAKFRFNMARNFVRAGFGYSNLTGQGNAYDASRMIVVSAREGFTGIKVKGMDTSLIAGRFRLVSECKMPHSFTGHVFHKGKPILENDPTKETSIPMEGGWKFATAQASVRGFGKVFHRIFLPFEGGGVSFGGPITEKRPVKGLGYSYTRFYPGASKVAVTIEGVKKESKGEAEVISPDGKRFSAPLAVQADNTFKAMIKLPAEKTRKAGWWKGAFIIDGKRYEDAFAFEEKKFPWQHNRLGYSNKILEPFTPIEFTNTTLKTVLREHTVAKNGLIDQAKSKGEEIFAAPLTLELVIGGEKHYVKPTRWKVYENFKHRVLTGASGDLGSFSYNAETAWDYDGFAHVKVKLRPNKMNGKYPVVDSLTLKAPLKKEHASLFHAMLDMTRGNPAGSIPAGKGKVWDSSTLIRKKNPQGVPWVPGEFCPYLWFGAEERGLALLFDSPKGFDLEDGKPMLRLVRDGDVVTAECDIMSRRHEVDKTVEFAFSFQVTPVKPRMPGWKKWVYDFGNRLPGMVHIQPIANASSFGIFPEGFRHTPDNTNHWMYARAYRQAMRKRRVDYNTLHHLYTEGWEEIKAWTEKKKDYFNRSYHGSAERAAKFMRIYIEADLTREAMTIDKSIPYNCSSIIGLGDPAYDYYKAEWATLHPYIEGMSDRIFLTPSTVDYLLWTYRDLLKNGADGINFDEMYVIPQSNPDLSEVRDYKNRCIPEMGIIAGRNMFKRLAYMLDEMGFKDRLIAPHLTNTMIIPEFAFCTLGIAWEYSISGNFTDQFPPDYCRAHSTGLQAGLAPVTLVLYRDPLRGKIPESEFCVRRNRSFRTAMGLCMQHQLTPMHRYWADFTEQYKVRYVLWAFGTHKDDCEFIPYWKKGNPFSVSDGFIIGAYKRGTSTLFMVTNLGKAGTAEMKFDRKALGLAENTVLTDVMTREKFPDGRFTIPECEFRMLFAGPEEFGAMLEPPEPDMGFIIK